MPVFRKHKSKGISHPDYQSCDHCDLSLFGRVVILSFVSLLARISFIPGALWSIAWIQRNPDFAIDQVQFCRTTRRKPQQVGILPNHCQLPDPLPHRPCPAPTLTRHHHPWLFDNVLQYPTPDYQVVLPVLVVEEVHYKIIATRFWLFFVSPFCTRPFSSTAPLVRDFCYQWNMKLLYYDIL